MAVRLGSNKWSYGEHPLSSADLNDTFEAVRFPIGSVLPWLKTYGEKVSGSNDSVATNKLVDSSATFQTSGVTQDMIVYNETDGTFSYVVSVDSETELTLADDIFTDTGKTYRVFATPRLPDGWVECNGQVINDPDSPYNGMTVPDLNGVSSGVKVFLRGSSTSGATGGEETHRHIWAVAYYDNAPKLRDGSGQDITNEVNYGTDAMGLPWSTGSTYNMYTDTKSNLPPYYEVVWVMKIK